MGLDVRDEPGGIAAAVLHNIGTQCGFHQVQSRGNGRLRHGRPMAGEIGRQPVQIDQRGHGNHPPIGQCIAQGRPQPGVRQGTTLVARRGLDRDALQMDPGACKCRKQHAGDERLFRLPFADDHHAPHHRLGLPPSTLRFHSSPSVW
jgi:hypothetical protein